MENVVVLYLVALLGALLGMLAIAATLLGAATALRVFGRLIERIRPDSGPRMPTYHPSNEDEDEHKWLNYFFTPFPPFPGGDQYYLEEYWDSGEDRHHH